MVINDRNMIQVYQNRHFRLACRYFSCLSIFDFHDILQALREVGYKPIAKVPPPEFGVRVGGASYIAEKDGLLIYFNTDKQILRVVSFDRTINIDRALNTFIEVLEIIRIDYDIEPQFYELVWELLAQPTKNPIQSFRALSDKLDFIRLINEKLGTNYSMYGIKVYQGERPNSPVWSEIKIEPHVYKNGRDYHISIIHRDTDWDYFGEYVKSILGKIETMIDVLESQ